MCIVLYASDSMYFYNVTADNGVTTQEVFCLLDASSLKDMKLSIGAQMLLKKYLSQPSQQYMSSGTYGA